ncbi:hypothetical protein NDU88_002627 [Pleurodeles waltl]|uniref:ABI gene family member 3 n=2 Tax=Pleurodeles waltl TaxID=8319 RepID=A0AAV7QAH2_PLEWA|nr:hypothetical protein NDU88_002627 [Pleurodeles waltl]
MSLASQSLASVAYQINGLAVNILKMLELETTKLRGIEENIYYISHKVDTHKEKVSRREIGAVTDSRNFQRTQKIVALANKDQIGSYSRKPLNFTILDNVGHGIKDSGSQLLKTGTMSRKASVKSSTQSPGSLGRSSRPPDPVHPPVVPEGKFSTGSSAMSSSGCSGIAGGFTSTFEDNLPPPPPPDHSTLTFEPQIFSPPTLPIPPPSPPQEVPPLPPPPPPPPLLSVPDFHLPPPPPPPPDDADFELPPLPPPVDYSPEQPSWVPNTYMETVPDFHLPPPPDDEDFELPPLPPPVDYGPEQPSWVPNTYMEKVPDFHLPPPPPDDADFELPPPPPPVDYDPEQPSWVPNTYMEKVVALYSYTQQKEDEISFSEGTVIYVTAKDADGWYQGVANGFSGYFPGNYVGSSC